MKSRLLVPLMLGMAPALLFAQEPPADKPPAEKPAEWRKETIEVSTAELRDIWFDASDGRIGFRVGDVQYRYSPKIGDYSKVPDLSGAVSACAAVLAELRCASKLKIEAQVRNAPANEKTSAVIDYLALIYDRLK